MNLSASPELRRAIFGADALIFDLDGTLVQTHGAHERSWRQAFGAVGLHMSTSWYRQRTGLTATQLIEDMVTQHDVRLDETEVRAAEFEYFLAEARTLTPFVPVCSIAEQFGDASRMAVASNGDARTVHATLAGAGLEHLFSVVITADDGARPKPFPDVFLLAAAHIKVTPEACLVFEDTEGGLEAARAAGMNAVDVRTWDVHAAGDPVIEVFSSGGLVEGEDDWRGGGDGGNAVG